MKIKKLVKKYGLALLCYGAYFAAALVCAILVFFCDLYYCTGERGNLALSLNDFNLINLNVNADGSLSSTTEDCQILLNKNITVRNLQYTLEGTSHAYAALLFYSENHDTEFSSRKCVRAKQFSDNSFYYKMPFKKIDSIRIDPINTIDTFKLYNIRANVMPAFYTYFIPSRTSIFFAILIPAISASALSYLRELFISIKSGVKK